MTDADPRNGNGPAQDAGGNTDMDNDALESALRAADRALLTAVHNRLPAPRAFAPPAPFHTGQQPTPGTSAASLPSASPVWQHITSRSYGDVHSVLGLLQRQLLVLQDDIPGAAPEIRTVADLLHHLQQSLDLCAATRPDALTVCARVRRLLSIVRTVRQGALTAPTDRRLTTCLHLVRELTAGITRLFDDTPHLTSTDRL